MHTYTSSSLSSVESFGCCCKQQPVYFPRNFCSCKCRVPWGLRQSSLICNPRYRRIVGYHRLCNEWKTSRVIYPIQYHCRHKCLGLGDEKVQEKEMEERFWGSGCDSQAQEMLNLLVEDGCCRKEESFRKDLRCECCCRFSSARRFCGEDCCYGEKVYGTRVTQGMSGEARFIDDLGDESFALATKENFRNALLKKQEKVRDSLLREKERNLDVGMESSLNGWKTRLNCISSLESKNRRVKWICALDSVEVDGICKKGAIRMPGGKMRNSLSSNAGRDSEFRQLKEDEHYKMTDTKVKNEETWNASCKENDSFKISGVQVSNEVIRKGSCSSTVTASKDSLSEKLRHNSSDELQLLDKAKSKIHRARDQKQEKTEIQGAAVESNSVLLSGNDRLSSKSFNRVFNRASQLASLGSSRNSDAELQSNWHSTETHAQTRREEFFQKKSDEVKLDQYHEDSTNQLHKERQSVSRERQKASDAPLKFDKHSTEKLTQTQKKDFFERKPEKFGIYQDHKDSSNQLQKESQSVSLERHKDADSELKLDSHSTEKLAQRRKQGILESKNHEFKLHQDYEDSGNQAQKESNSMSLEGQKISEAKPNFEWHPTGKLAQTRKQELFGSKSDRFGLHQCHEESRNRLQKDLAKENTEVVLEKSNSDSTKAAGRNSRTEPIKGVEVENISQKMRVPEEENKFSLSNKEEAQKKQGTLSVVASVNNSEESRPFKQIVMEQSTVNSVYENRLVEKEQLRKSNIRDSSRANERIANGSSNGTVSRRALGSPRRPLLTQPGYHSKNPKVTVTGLDSESSTSAEAYKRGNVCSREPLKPSYRESFYVVTDKIASRAKPDETAEDLITSSKLGKSFSEDENRTSNSPSLLLEEPCSKSSSHDMPGISKSEQNVEIPAHISVKSGSGNNSDDSESNMTMFSAEGNEDQSQEAKVSHESPPQTNVQASPGDLVSEGPSEEVWAITGCLSRDGSDGHRSSDREKEKSPETLPSEDSSDKLRKNLAKEETEKDTLIKSDEKAIAKRSGRGLWGFLADFCIRGWTLHNVENSSIRGGSGQLSDESPDSEDWHSVPELEGAEFHLKKKSKKDKRKLRANEQDGISDKVSLDTVNKGVQPQNAERLFKDKDFEDSGESLNNQQLIRRHATIPGDRYTQRLEQNEEKSDPEDKSSAKTNEQLQKSVTTRPSRNPLYSQSVLSIGLISNRLHGDNNFKKNFVERLPSPTSIANADKSESVAQYPELEEKKGSTGNLKRSKQVPKETFTLWEEALILESEQRKEDEKFMRVALEEAKFAADCWEVPVGAVLVQNGRILARAHNLVEANRDATAHAEMLCIRFASNQLKTWRLAETTLYVTLEPCPMCAGAILQARIGTIVWGAPNKLLGADGSWISLFPRAEEMSEGTSALVAPVHPFHPNIKIRRGILRNECSEIMQQFFKLRRKKEKKTGSTSCFSLVKHPSKLFSRFHDIFSIFCL
eukprot:TRINITY_DN9323_c0_g1_i1.p1 TRINITY_DN9323_c0_g1~~TRINITY_DN9323_c0_g1_i1.p1  ORF type:complete len:1470 (-),score=346.80 TRINITY_DN9323_c0_g1_i1:300-4709(-)